MATPYIGEIRQFAGNFAPQGWSFCNGATLLIANYSTLFALIGTTYGGNGTTTFVLPDLRGRVPIHQGANAGSTYVMGQAAGQENVTLVTGQLPAHTHQVAASSAGESDTPANNIWATASANAKPYGTAPSNTNMNAASISNAGGSQSHFNLVPYQTISFIIALQGVYPSQ